MPFPLLSGLVVAVPMLVLGCGGENPVPKQGQSSRPPSLQPQRYSAGPQVSQEPTFDFYAPSVGGSGHWQPGRMSESMPPFYLGPYPVQAYGSYGPRSRGGGTGYGGYRFRPLQPDEAGFGYGESAQEASTWGTRWHPGFRQDGMGGLQAGRAEYGQGPPMRFRPLEEKQTGRSPPPYQGTYGADRFGDTLYPPLFFDQDAYGFQPEPR